MREYIEEVLSLQAKYSHTKTPAMDRRGVLTTGKIPAEVTKILAGRDKLASLGWSVEGSNGKGFNAAVPWVRIFDEHRSPSATNGWYVVYLFNAAGKSAYLTLMQGTSEWSQSRRKFVARPADIIAKRVEWARSVLPPKAEDLKTQIELNSSYLQPKGYERGVVFAIEYLAGGVPDDAQLSADIGAMSDLLRQLYLALDTSAFLPGDAAPEVTDATLAAAQAAGNAAQPSGQGFNLSAVEKSAIEEHAVKLATDYFEGQHYTVSNVGDQESFDLLAAKPGTQLSVEVKGTVSMGAQVVLTFNEVEHHRDAFPHNALVVVHSIQLSHTGSRPVASGGTIVVTQPWSIEHADLKPISYRYTTGL